MERNAAVGESDERGVVARDNDEPAFCHIEQGPTHRFGRRRVELGRRLIGDDRALGGTNDVYHRAASIAAITVKGAFTQSTIAAGINPGDNVIGNADDTPEIGQNRVSSCP